MPSQMQQIQALTDEDSFIDRLSEEDIRDLTSISAFTKGQYYQRQGRVLSLSIAADGTRIEASVRGSRPKPYSQAIKLFEKPNETDIEGLFA